MVSRTYGLNELKQYKFVVILSIYQGKLLLSRHKERTTWETQGGHIESGETPLEAARRELYEESGALEYEIHPVCDYWAGDPVTGEGANGMVFQAEIKKLGAIPESEMAEVEEFDTLPANLTYPAITPVLFGKIGRVTVVVDRKMGTYHPEHKDLYYPVNYGYIPGLLAGDGEEQDAYILGVEEPVDQFTGKIIAVIHRKNDVEDKWVVGPENMEFSEQDIAEKVQFQEQYFDTEIIRM